MNSRSTYRSSFGASPAFPITIIGYLEAQLFRTQQWIPEFSLPCPMSHSSVHQQPLVMGEFCILFRWLCIFPMTDITQHRNLLWTLHRNPSRVRVRPRGSPSDRPPSLMFMRQEIRMVIGQGPRCSYFACIVGKHHLIGSGKPPLQGMVLVLRVKRQSIWTQTMHGLIIANGSRIGHTTHFVA